MQHLKVVRLPSESLDVICEGWNTKTYLTKSKPGKLKFCQYVICILTSQHMILYEAIKI